MWASLPGWESIVPDFLKKFETKKITQDEFTFCGREYVQDSDFNFFISCKSNTQKILPINYERRGRKKATAGEICQMRRFSGKFIMDCKA
eukprot:5706233-Karenia_brevis.AAC.1